MENYLILIIGVGGIREFRLMGVAFLTKCYTFEMKEEYIVTTAKSLVTLYQRYQNLMSLENVYFMESYKYQSIMHLCGIQGGDWQQKVLTVNCVNCTGDGWAKQQ